MAACGKREEPEPAPAPTAASAGSAAAPKQKWIECTEAQRAPMQAALLARNHLAAPDEKVDGLTCVTIQLAHQPAFFVELVGTRDEKRHRLHGVLATDGSSELVPLHDAPLDFAQLRGGKVWFETIDLDGDGTEELVVHRGDELHPSAEWIDLVAIRGAALVELKGPRLSYDDPDLDESCRATLATAPEGAVRVLVVTTMKSTGASEHCLAQGRHVFALAGDKLVQHD
jgi:hypothetical protein